jgi:hypothetical protein
MVGLRYWDAVLIDSPDWDDLVDYLGGPTSEAQLCTLKVLLHGAGGPLLSSWQSVADAALIDNTKLDGLVLKAATADPVALVDSQVWYRTDTGKPSFRRGGTTDRFVSENLAETLANKTLTTPTIADFTNATLPRSQRGT